MDLDGDNSIGGTVTSTAYSNNAAPTDSWNNFTIYNTEVGMVTAIGDYSLTVGDDLRAIAWDINGSTTAATTSQGFNLLTNNGSGFQLDNGQSILTAKAVGAAGYLISEGSDAVIELFIADESGTISQLGFNNAGEQVSEKQLSAVEVRTQEIRTATDLDGNGVIGITLGNQLAYATGDPSVEYSISAVNENGVINSVNRLNSDGTTTHISEGFGDWQTFQDWLDAGNTPNPPNNSVRLSVFDTAEGIALTNLADLASGDDFEQPGNTSNTISEDRGVLLIDGNGSSFNLPTGETVLTAQKLRSDYSNSNNSGFKLFSRNASGDVIQRLFSADGEQQEQITLNSAQISLVETETGIDLDNNDIIGSTVTGKAYTNNTDQTNNGTNVTIYSTTAGLVSSFGNYSLTIGDDLRSVAWRATAAATGMAHGITVLSSNGEPWALDEGQTIESAKRSSNIQLASGATGEAIELFIADSGSGDVVQVLFNGEGELITTSEEPGLPLSGTIAASDVDSTTLTYSLNGGGIDGFNLNPTTGEWTFDTHHAAYNSMAAGDQQTIKVGYTVSDEQGASTTAEFTINLTGTNDAPVATFSAAQSTIEDAAKISGQLTSSDPDTGDTLSYSLIGDPIDGLTINTDGTWSFDPSIDVYNALAQDQSQEITVRYSVTDSTGATDDNSFVITITGTNDAPVATFTEAQSATEDDKTLPLYGTIQDPNGDGNVLYLLRNGADPIPGFSINSPGDFTFDPSVDQTRVIADGEVQTITVPIDVFTITPKVDGVAETQFEFGGSTSFDITLTGTANGVIASAPELIGADLNYEPSNRLGGQLTATDADAGDTLSYSLTGNPIDGLTINSDGIWSFDPSVDAYDSIAAGATTDITVEYTVTDSTGATDDNSFVITLTGTNDAPVATFIEAQSTTEDAAKISGQLTSSDPDTGDTLSYSPIGDPIDGLNINPDGTWSFDPAVDAYNALAKDQTQEITVRYSVTDEAGATDDNSFVITLTGTNDAPVATFDAAQAAAEGDQSLPLYGQLPATDDDGDLTYAIATGSDPIDGLTINSDGSWSFDPTADNTRVIADGETQTITVALDVTNTAGVVDNFSFDITLTGTATGINIAAPDATNLITGQLTATDIDAGDILSYSPSGDPIDGLTINSNGTWSFDPSVDAYNALAEGSMEQTSPLTTPSQMPAGATADNSFVITLTGTNDAPVASILDLTLTSGNEDSLYIFDTAELLTSTPTLITMS